MKSALFVVFAKFSPICNYSAESLAASAAFSSEAVSLAVSVVLSSEAVSLTVSVLSVASALSVASLLFKIFMILFAISSVEFSEIVLCSDCFFGNTTLV